MSKIKFNINKEKLLSVFLRHRYLFILIFFSILLAFVFNIMYKYAYADINFMEYEESYEGRVSSNIKKGNRTLREVLKEIEEREKRFETEESMEYSNPFGFRDLDTSEDDETEKTGFDNGLMLSLPEDDLIPSDSTESTKSVEIGNDLILPPPIEIEND